MKTATSPDAPSSSADERADAHAADDEVEGTADAIVCFACRAAIARRADRVERFGAREHDRVNPAGFVFRIACFDRADGARAIGAPSMDFAWFPRAPWRVALCGACGVHLGWWFGGDAPFFGLDVRAVVDGP